MRFSTNFIAACFYRVLFSRRDLGDVLPAGSWTPTILVTALVVAGFLVWDVVKLMPS